MKPPYSQSTIQQLEAWDKQYVWHPFTQMKDYAAMDPMIISHAEGAYLYNIHGKRYFDGNSSLWLNLHGHCHPKLNQALQGQLERISHSTLLGQANVPSIELAKQLADISPAGLDKVFYSDNGSTANEVALKMAFQYWRQSKDKRPSRKTYMSFDNAYHGDTVGGVSVGGIDLFHGIFGDLLFERYGAPYPVYSKYTSKQPAETITGNALSQCEDILKTHQDDIAAVMIEPIVQGAAGILTQSPGFLAGLRELCNRYDTFLIADEVFTGFGRTGDLFACNRENVSPDFMTLAKGITGGYCPLAATLTTQRVFEGFLAEYSEFKTFFHGHSYTGNQLGCAAALANLDIFAEEQPLERMKPVVRHLETRMDRLFDAHDTVSDIHQTGLIAGIDLCQSRTKNQAFRVEDAVGAKVCLQLREHGIWLRPLGNTLVLVPPLITTIDEIDVLVDAIETHLKAL